MIVIKENEKVEMLFACSVNKVVFKTYLKTSKAFLQNYLQIFEKNKSVFNHIYIHIYMYIYIYIYSLNLNNSSGRPAYP